MKISITALDKRIFNAQEGYVTEPEYLPTLVREWAYMPIKSYLRGYPEELERLYQLLHLPGEADPPYCAVARMVFDKMESSGGAQAEEVQLLAVPLQAVGREQREG